MEGGKGGEEEGQRGAEGRRAYREEGGGRGEARGGGERKTDVCVCVRACVGWSSNDIKGNALSKRVSNQHGQAHY